MVFILSGCRLPGFFTVIDKKKEQNGQKESGRKAGGVDPHIGNKRTAAGENLNGLVRDGAQHADERKVEKIASTLEIFAVFIVLQAEQKRKFHTQKAVFRKMRRLAQ